MSLNRTKEEFVKPKSAGGLSKTKVSEAEIQIKREEMQEAKEANARKIVDLHNKYLNMQATLGEDHPATFMLATVLEIVCELKSVQDQIEAMSIAVDALGSTFQVLESSFQFMDSTFDMINNIMSSNTRSYGPIAKLKMARQSKRFVKSMSARIDEFTAKLNVLPAITVSLQGAMSSFRTKMAKTKAKQEKQKAAQSKKAGTSAAAAPSTGLSASTVSVLSSLGANTGAAGGGAGAPASGGAPSGGSAPSTPASSSSGSASNDFGEDIF